MCDHLNFTSDKPGIQVSDSFRDWSGRFLIYLHCRPVSWMLTTLYKIVLELNLMKITGWNASLLVAARKQNWQ